MSHNTILQEYFEKWIINDHKVNDKRITDALEVIFGNKCWPISLRDRLMVMLYPNGERIVELDNRHLVKLTRRYDI